ncbi:gluconate 2-dehydrogenase subunit 3 family protein [Flavobacterium sp.]|uniref:gluconate 2-dehydrogenase subunit 3 family protein n=1 Tax=Flavobacterium sp. TaxID=239 RepID=UPI00286C3F28|nr:gluconate 2-dehydrogenase subunit 3 family protein [Flavobacterium sp.]
MTRRDLIKNIALLSGGVFIGSSFLLVGCKNENSGALVFGEEIFDLLSEVAETMIPETTTPGAKSTGVPNFIGKVFEDIYTSKEQKDFLAALKLINTKAKEKIGRDFVDLSQEKREQIINEVKNPKDLGFLALYQIVLYGYLTSEEGLKANFRYTPVPGKFVGDIPYKKGDKMYMGLSL